MILPRVLPAAFLLACLHMCHGWCLHTYAHVWAFCVVEQDDTFQFLLAYLPCGNRHFVKPFCLKDAVGPLRHGIFQGVAALGHADAYVVPLQFLHIGLAGILASTVGVVYQHGGSLIVYRGQCHPQCLQWIGCLERWPDSPADYHVRVGIRDEG